MPSARSRRSTPKPSMPGIITSRITASGRTSRALSSAAGPLEAVWTSKPWNFRLTERSSTILVSSSTTRTRASGTFSGSAAMAIVRMSPNFLAMKLQGGCQLPVNHSVRSSVVPG